MKKEYLPGSQSSHKGIGVSTEEAIVKPDLEGIKEKRRGGRDASEKAIAGIAADKKTPCR